MQHAPVAQLDRALAYEARGWEFESLQVYKKNGPVVELAVTIEGFTKRLLFYFFYVFINMRYKYIKEELENAIIKTLSIAGVCRELGIKPCGGNYKTLNSKIKEWGLDISHFTGSAWNQGEQFKKFGKKYKLKDVLIDKSPYKSSYHLKERLYKENLKSKQCEECGLTEWNGKEIKFELDHINGDNTDNRIENLKILCPNCHSQTPTFRNKRRK